MPQKIKLKNLREEEVFELTKSTNIIFVAKDLTSLSSTLNIYAKASNIQINVILRLIPATDSQINIDVNLFADNSIQNVTANMELRALIITSNSKVEIKPILHIQGDTHEINHKVAIGGVEDKQLQFLMMRGINKEEAKKLLAEGFLNVN